MLRRQAIYQNIRINPPYFNLQSESSRPNSPINLNIPSEASGDGGNNKYKYINTKDPFDVTAADWEGELATVVREFAIFNDALCLPADIVLGSMVVKLRL